METFICTLAGVNVKITAKHPEVKSFCREYITEKEEDFTVSVTTEEIEHERRLSEETSLKEEGEVINYPDYVLEELALYRKITEKMLDYDVILVHGSAVAVDGKAYLFTAKSGTGKSTHVRLWCKKFGDRAVVVNDDKPLVKITEEGAVVCGTPWMGKHSLGRNIEVPLKAICGLERGVTNTIKKRSVKEMLSLMLKQVHVPAGEKNTMKTLSLIEKLLNSTEQYVLCCNKNPEAADVAYEGMK